MADYEIANPKPAALIGYSVIVVLKVVVQSVADEEHLKIIRQGAAA